MTNFKVAAVSSNTNAFGLHQFIFLAEDGTCWTACKNKQYARHKFGDIVPLGEDPGQTLSSMGYEIPQQKEQAPQGVIEEVFGAPA